MQIDLSLKQFSDNYIYSPYAYLNKYINEENLRAYFIENLEKYIKNNNPFCVETEKSIATIEKREFDTNILGMNSASMNYFLLSNIKDEGLKQNLITKIDSVCIEKGIQYLTTRISMNDIATIQLLESNGYITIDNLITFSMEKKQTQDFSYIEEAYDISILDKKNLQHVEKLKEISQFSFLNDRFHNDPIISDVTANQVYYEWMANSCKNNSETIVTVIDKTNTPLGFVICQISEITTIKIGTIVLIAVDNHFRGMNIGYNMLVKAFRYFESNDVDIIQVGTQLSNIPAQRLYLKMNFKPVSTTTTLRKYYI